MLTNGIGPACFFRIQALRTNNPLVRLPRPIPKGTSVPRLRQALPARRLLHRISDAVEAWRECLHYCPARLWQNGSYCIGSIWARTFAGPDRCPFSWDRAG